MCTKFKIEVAMAVSAFFDSIAEILLEEMHQVSGKHSDIISRMKEGGSAASDMV